MWVRTDKDRSVDRHTHTHAHARTQTYEKNFSKPGECPHLAKLKASCGHVPGLKT